MLHFQRDYLVAKLTGYDSFDAGREDGKEKGGMMTIFYLRERFEKITGDFNADEGSVPYRNFFTTTIGSPILRDTFRVAFADNGPDEGTFSGFVAANTTGPRIDWIAVGETIEVKGAAIDRRAHEGRTPSDHFPVTAILEVRAR